MQFSFKFDAPTYCCLTSLPSKRRSSEYMINQNDPADYWFMHPHLPPDTQINQRVISETVVQEIFVIRKQLQSQVEKKVQKNAQKQQQKQEQQENVSRVQFQQVIKQKQIEQEIIKQVHLEEKKPKERHKLMNNDDKNKIKTKRQKVSAPKIYQSVINRHRSFSMGAVNRPILSVDKTNKKDIRPCPFPPRIEREWNSRYHKNWYHLSPQSKVIAEGEMNAIYEQKMNKSKEENIKIDKGKKQFKKFKF